MTQRAAFPLAEPADDDEPLAHDLGGRLMAKLPREPMHFVMERRMMIGLKQLAEGQSRERTLNQDGELARARPSFSPVA